jgi:hypothetical protein
MVTCKPGGGTLPWNETDNLSELNHKCISEMEGGSFWNPSPGLLARCLCAVFRSRVRCQVGAVWNRDPYGVRKPQGAVAVDGYGRGRPQKTTKERAAVT